MEGFLDEVARDLYARHGDHIGDLYVLFPSRRARLFFTEALSRIAERPVWQPRWTTIDELMSEISGLQTGDRLRLITELYKIYAEYHPEPFDKFYFWGEMLLTDFDTIDKYRIDARQLFRNLTDLKELEADISYLTPQQLEIIRHFWSTLGPEADLSTEKRRFLAIWKTLCPVYERFRRRLAELGIAYNGMMQRAAADRIRAGEKTLPAGRSYVVAGFNALTECEKILFDHLSATAATDFYWDCDDYYLRREEQEAGMFVRHNVMRFPARGAIGTDHLLRDKRLTAVATASNALQCKQAAAILSELQEELRRETGDPEARLGKETAVVLTDENLLLPLLYALPEGIGGVNVTMGYPLRQTLAYTFVERLLGLQARRRRKGSDRHFYHADVSGLLAHPYLADHDARLTRELLDELQRERRITVPEKWLGRNDLFRGLFRTAEGWRGLSRYLTDTLSLVARMPAAGEEGDRRNEYLAVIAEELAKLHNSLDTCEVELTEEIYASLLRRHLQTLRIPFEGEPLEGLQVMGILETRNLDFRHVVILSMNDDNFPGNRLTQSTFIPYNLRTAFALPTPEHHEGVYAYYFYRLIQRAESVHMLYCSHADDKSTGEPSRYIYQLDYESGLPLRKVEAGVDVNRTETAPIRVPKDAGVMERLERFVSSDSPATLSPTAFFRYVACPLRFYFHSVARLSSDEELNEEIDAPMFGTILHAAAQRLYAAVENESRPGGTLRALMRTDAVARAVEESINENYLHDPHAAPADYPGNLLLVRDIVIRYLRNGVMSYDAAHDDFTVVGLEREVDYRFPFRCGERRLEMKFAGVADRIDRLEEGTLRVVDYKTGTPHLDFDGVESLFCGEGRQRLSNIIQTLLYAMMLHHKYGCDAVPTLFYVRSMNRPDYSPLLIDRAEKLTGARYSRYKEPFERLVAETLAELYDSAVPFTQCEDAESCRFCDFNKICKR